MVLSFSPIVDWLEIILKTIFPFSSPYIGEQRVLKKKNPPITKIDDLYIIVVIFRLFHLCYVSAIFVNIVFQLLQWLNVKIVIVAT